MYCLLQPAQKRPGENILPFKTQKFKVGKRGGGTDSPTLTSQLKSPGPRPIAGRFLKKPLTGLAVRIVTFCRTCPIKFCSVHRLLFRYQTSELIVDKSIQIRRCVRKAYILSLQSEEKEVVTHQLLRLLPLLQVGKASVKKAYLQLIPELLSHTIHKGVNVEESRQLLSYSLIHPAITTEERGNFQMWMGNLEDRFTHSAAGGGGGMSSSNTAQNNQHNLVYHQHHLHCGGSSSSSGSSTAASSSVGGSSSSNNNLSVGSHSHCHSPSPASSSHHSIGLNSSPDISASQEYINIITNNLAIPPPPTPPAPSAPAAPQSPAMNQQQQQQHHHHPPPEHGGSGNSHLAWGGQQTAHGQSLMPPDNYPGTCEAGAAINPPVPSSSTATSAESSSACCAQPFVPRSNGHLTLRAANSHVGAFGAAPGHTPLHATSSAPPKFNSMPPPSGPSQAPVPQQNSHPPLRRTHSITPPVRLQNSEKTVSEWLQTNHGHHHQPFHLNVSPHQQHGQQKQQQQQQQPLQLQLQQQQLHVQPPPQQQHPILSSRSGQYSEHAPLSPQSSVTSSGSGGSDSHCLQLLEDGPQPSRDNFLEPGSGMREVPVWLKSLRLHKYAYLFKQLSYEEMLGITENMLEQQNVTKGARHKIYVSIVKLRERQNLLRQLEKNIVEEGGSIMTALGEMKAMLNTPIKASQSTSPQQQQQQSSSTTSSSSSSPQSPSSTSADDVQEGDLPAQFCRLMGKIFTQLLTASSRDDVCFQLYLQLLDKCLIHEAFLNQKKLLQSWKQTAQKIWQPPQRYGDRPRGRFGNTFPLGASLGSRIIPRASRGPVPYSTHGGHQVLGPGGMQQWSFGSKRSILGSGCGGGGGHMPVQRNSSLNAPFINKPGLLEQTKQPVSRTHSAPIHRPVTLPLQGCDANDTEINARLDSLCISMTEHALGSSDNNDRGSHY
ncbi:protein smaug homolog 1-like [Plakobranchus ocellatus]|uniref:Protein smaug homolog 1-like n=1 Tax=Plakobranchus ocellatus TaxID=259542 RepID=A0AAV4CUS1_9GAST|nr:protein smaug homolog 1-like [Plakobranchus ocellatus]